MSSTIFSIAWVKGAGERAIKSFVQGGITGLLGSGAINAADVASQVPDVLALPWYAALSAGIVMALLSIATSVMGADFTAGAPSTTAQPALEAEPDDQEIDEDVPDEDLEGVQTGIDSDVTIEDDEYPDVDEDQDASEDFASTDHADSDDPDAAPRHVSSGS